MSRAKTSPIPLLSVSHYFSFSPLDLPVMHLLNILKVPLVVLFSDCTVHANCQILSAALVLLLPVFLP